MSCSEVAELSPVRLDRIGTVGAARVKPAAIGLELGQGRVHQRRVEGVTDRQGAGSNTVRGAVVA